MHTLIYSTFDPNPLIRRTSGQGYYSNNSPWTTAGPQRKQGRQRKQRKQRNQRNQRKQRKQRNTTTKHKIADQLAWSFAHCLHNSNKGGKGGAVNEISLSPSQGSIYLFFCQLFQSPCLCYGATTIRHTPLQQRRKISRIICANLFGVCVCVCVFYCYYYGPTYRVYRAWTCLEIDTRGKSRCR